MFNYMEGVLEHVPIDGFKLTTYRMDIYNENLAKTQFIDQFEALYKAHNSDRLALSELPTAFYYFQQGDYLSYIGMKL